MGRHAILYSQNQSLIILKLREEDAGEYECKVSFGEEKISFTTRLSGFPSPVFSHKPIWKIAPQDKEAFLEDSVELRCSAMLGQQYNTVSLEPVQAAWYRNGEELTSGHRIEIKKSWEEDDIVLNLSLKINKVDSDDEGEYQCRMENRYGVLEKNVQLKVLDNSKVMKETENVKQEIKSILSNQIQILSKIARISAKNYDKTKNIISWLQDKNEI